MAMAVVAAFVGCADEPPAPTSTTESTRPPGNLTNLTYINPLPGNPLWDQYGECITHEASKHGIRVRSQGPPGGNVNIQAMQNMLSQAVVAKAQAIVTWSLAGPAAFDALFARARAQGAVVATLLSVGATKNQTFEVGIRYADWARLQIRAVAKRTGPQRVGVIWQKAAGPAYAEYVNALKDEVSRHPNVSLEDLQFNNGNFTEDVAIASTMLTAHPEINVLVNYSGFPGVLTAIKERRLVGRVVAIIGSDYPEATVRAIDEGIVAGVFIRDACFAGRLVVQKFLDAWAGKPVAPTYSDRSKIVTGAQFKRLNAGHK